MSSSKADISEDFLATSYPAVLDELLSDKTTGTNIIWACDDYVHLGEGFSASDEITVECITGVHGDVIQPRTYKAQANQSGRTKDKAEVFTPSWIVNIQNNEVDTSWFGYPYAFNIECDDGRTWRPTEVKVGFPDVASNLDEAADDSLKTWQSYVREPRMEITCGEAPYLDSRYDTTTGKTIPIRERVGLLDRKLRVIEENVLANHDHEQIEWMDWVIRAYKSIYGFEWQGDNLLIARENLLFTFFDVYRARYRCDPQADELRKIAEIISWNVFQMDGFTKSVPLKQDEDGNAIPVLIMDWERDEAEPFVTE